MTTANSGLLWFDDNPYRGITEKVQRAVARYQQKYGRRPTLCFVHPTLLGGNGRARPIQVGEVEVQPSRAVLPDHIWVQ
ncbi:MAG: hypothetical protein N3B68_13790 [Anaerolineae bacterium]|nr:hypothetical protein [Anaerolineae bacterium]